MTSDRASRPGAAGLAELLDALGFHDKARHVQLGVLLVAAFEVSFVTVASLQAVAERAAGWSPVLVMVAVWVIWTVWHSVVFPRNRERYLRDDPRPYRRAFVFDIYPWVTIGFAQMWRPLFNGNTLSLLMSPGGGSLGALEIGWPSLVASLAMAVTALLIMVRAISTIGIANAAFVPEFRDPAEFMPVEQGVYGRFLHPLFWSGILFSLGLAVLVGTPTARAIAGVNVAYGVVYSVLEARRLRKVFGSAYGSYAERVPGLPVHPALFRRHRSESEPSRGNSRSGSDRT